MIVFKAEVHTRNFHFEAFGATEEDARLALFQGLIAHGKQYKCSPSWWSEYSADIECQPITLGVAYRDREAI